MTNEATPDNFLTLDPEYYWQGVRDLTREVRGLVRIPGENEPATEFSLSNCKLMLHILKTFKEYPLERRIIIDMLNPDGPLTQANVSYKTGRRTTAEAMLDIVDHITPAQREDWNSTGTVNLIRGYLATELLTAPIETRPVVDARYTK